MDTTFTDGVSLTTAAWFQDENDAIYKGIGLSGLSVVASATTPDVFAATLSHTISYTGTTTSTGFAASVKAGQTRELLCSGISTFTNGANYIVAGGDFTSAAGDRILCIAETTTKFRLYPIKASGSAVVSSFTAVNGVSRNSKMSATSANASQTFTADEIMVSTVLGGTPQILASYSQVCNLGTTGAGGMDTGTAPISGFVSVYAIAKADGTKSVLACAVATSTASIYGGANMPSGYTYSALIGIIPTDGSSRFKPGMLLDRRWMYQTFAVVLNGGSAAVSLTSQSISGAVPAAAKAFSAIMGSSSSGANSAVSLSADSTGTGGQTFEVQGSSPIGAIGGMSATYGAGTFKDIPLITAQTTFYLANCSGTVNLSVTDYTV